MESKIKTAKCVNMNYLLRYSDEFSQTMYEFKKPTCFDINFVKKFCKISAEYKLQPKSNINNNYFNTYVDILILH